MRWSAIRSRSDSVLRPSGLAAAIAAVLIASSGAWQPGRAAPAQTIKLTAKEFAFEPKEVSGRPGEMTFVVENDGAVEHNMAIEDAAKKTIAQIAVIAPGKSEQLRVALRAGTYTIFCDLPGHRDAGMVASLKVRD